MALFKNAHLLYLSCNACQAKECKSYAANFEEAQKIVSVNEGGYTDNPRDKGNWTGGDINNGILIGTKYGISAPTLAAYFKRTPSKTEMQNLEYSTAINIYKANYWSPIKGDQINNQRVANMIYDVSVNNGVGGAQKLVKDTLGISTYDVNKINAANADTLFNKIGAAREAAYKAKGGEFLNSWLSRLKNLGYTGLDVVKTHMGAAIGIALALGILITGIVLLKKK